MSEITYKTGWIKDSEGNKFAPITTTDQVITKDGTDLGTELNGLIEANISLVAENTELKNQVAELSNNTSAEIKNGVVSDGNAKIYRRGKVVTLVFDNAVIKDAITGWTSTVCQVDAEYAPGYDFYFAGTDEKVYYMFSYGKIICTTSQEAGAKLYATVTYVIND